VNVRYNVYSVSIFRTSSYCRENSVYFFKISDTVIVTIRVRTKESDTRPLRSRVLKLVQSVY